MDFWMDSFLRKRSSDPASFGQLITKGRRGSDASTISDGSWKSNQTWILVLYGGLERCLEHVFPYIRNVIIPTDELIFFRGAEATNQNILSSNGTVSHQSIEDNAIMCAAPSYTREVAYWYHLISRRCTYRCSCRNLPWTSLKWVMSKHQQESVHHDTQPVDYPGTTACVCIQATKWVRTTCKNPAKIQCCKIQKICVPENKHWSWKPSIRKYIIFLEKLSLLFISEFIYRRVIQGF